MIRWWFGFHCCVYGRGWWLDSLQPRRLTGMMRPGADGCTPAAGMHHRQHAGTDGICWGSCVRPSEVALCPHCLRLAAAGCRCCCRRAAPTGVWSSLCRKRHLGALEGLTLGRSSPCQSLLVRCAFLLQVLLVVCCKCHVLCVDKVWRRMLQLCSGRCRTGSVVMCLDRALPNFDGPLQQCAVFEVLALLYLTCTTCSTGRPALVLTCSNAVGQVGETQVKG